MIIHIIHFSFSFTSFAWFSYISFIFYQTMPKIIYFNKSMFCTQISLFKPIRTVLLTISVCFPDVVNLNLKSTLRVLYNLFTNYKNSD